MFVQLKMFIFFSPSLQCIGRYDKPFHCVAISFQHLKTFHCKSRHETRVGIMLDFVLDKHTTLDEQSDLKPGEPKVLIGLLFVQFHAKRESAAERMKSIVTVSRKSNKTSCHDQIKANTSLLSIRKKLSINAFNQHKPRSISRLDDRKLNRDQIHAHLKRKFSYRSYAPKSGSSADIERPYLKLVVS